jgi:RHS repeat-associated protein
VIRAPSIYDQISIVTRSQYDGAGHVIFATDGNNNVTQSVYDGDGRVIEKIMPSVSVFAGGTTTTTNPTTTTVYDAASNAILTTDANGDETETQFDARNRPVRTILDLNGNDIFDPTQGASATDIVNVTGYDLNGNKIYTVDPNGNRNDTTYDADNRPIEIEGPAIADAEHGGAMTRPTTTTAYDHDGNVISVTDPRGIVTATSYDSLNRARFVTQNATAASGSADQLVTEARYDANGNKVATVVHNVVAGVVTPEVTVMAYDAFNRKTTTTQPDPDGSGPETSPVTTDTYDRAGDVLSQTDPNDNLTSYVYDRHGRKTETIQPSVSDGTSTATPIATTSYDDDGNVISTTDPNDHTTTTDYDALNRKSEVIQPDPDGSGPETSPTSFYAYDADGNLTKVTDPNGNVSTTEYDRANRKAEVTQPDPDGAGPETAPVTTYAYDASGNMVSTTDPLGHTTTTAYDGLNRKITQTQPDPDGSGPETAPVTHIAYDLDGNTVTTTDALGHVTTLAYDGLNRKVTETDPDPDGAGPETSPVTTTVYDPAGNTLSTTDPLGHVTTFGYDLLNRKISETDPDPDGSGPLAAPVTTWQYDADGNMVAMTDPLGNASGGVAADHTTNYEYDALNRQTAVIQPSIDGGTTRPTETEVYDFDGNLLSDTDPDANKTSYTYDGLNRQISETDPLGHVSTTAYDANSNVIATTDRDGRTDDFTYDALNRKITETWLDTGAVTTWTFNAKNLLTEVSDAAATYDYGYDNLDRPTMLTLSLAGLSTPVILTETYDSDGNRLGLSANVNGTADFANTFGYDDLNRLIQAQQTGQTGGNAVAPKQADFTYDSASNLTDLSRYGDLTGTTLAASTTYGYDDQNRMTSLDTTSGSTNIDDSMGYDVASRMTSLTTPDGASTLAYDNDNQLTSASLTAESYTYDSNGNRVAATLGTGASGTNSVGGNNELQSDATYDYSYDNEGNLISRTKIDGTGSDAFTWDDRNRLTQVVSRDGSGTITQTATYGYDDTNDRISKTITDGSGVTTLAERYVYDSNGNLLLVLDGPTGAVTEREFNGPAENQTLASEVGVSGATAGTTNWLLTDYQGTVRDVADNSGAILDHLVYDSFGNIVSQTDPTDAPRLGYTGQQIDPETGFNYDHARYYNPETGTFLNQDPKGFKAGDQNLYRYVDNSPLDKTDPTGMSSWYSDPSWYGALAKSLWNDSLKPTLNEDVGGLQALGQIAPVYGVGVSNQASGTDISIQVAKQAAAAYDNTVSNTANVMAHSFVASGNSDSWSSTVSALSDGASYSTGNILGFTPILEASYNIDLSTQTQLDPTGGWNQDRFLRLNSGVGQAAGWSAGVASSYNNDLDSFTYQNSATPPPPPAGSPEAGTGAPASQITYQKGLSYGDEEIATPDGFYNDHPQPVIAQSGTSAAASGAPAIANDPALNPSSLTLNQTPTVAAENAGKPRSNPFTGEPGSTSSTDTAAGGPKQVRQYGPDGYPETDVDYDHDHGQGQPHAHDWGRPGDGGPPTAGDRGIGRPVQPSDPQHPNAGN